tara:strand:- start:133 stop:357 length:225 start_codon:yes stop_codon:yes gene_type:complete
MLDNIKMQERNIHYKHCDKVIRSCKTQEQLNDARNLVDNFLKLHGEDSMHEWMILMNQILNSEMLINYASKDSE